MLVCLIVGQRTIARLSHRELHTSPAVGAKGHGEDAEGPLRSEMGSEIRAG